MGPQWHGPMVASVAVGKTVGVAPEAELFYIGQLNYDWENGRTHTLRYLVQGIYRLLEINKQLPQNNKIRAISISKGWTRSDKDFALIAEAVQKAHAEGILMVFTSVELFNGGYDIHKLGRSPLANPDDFESYGPAMSDTRRFWEDDSSSADDSYPKEIYVPTDSRTTASPMSIDEYVFDRNGGSSKYPPYIAGVYALAVQVDPSITPERFWALAAKTGRTIEIERNGKKRRLRPILDPVRLIRSIETGEAIMISEKQHYESRIIVPGVGMGDFTLGMSKDKVLKKLGKPGVIGFAGKRYTLDNLPRRYLMSFGDISFAMVDDIVTGISMYSPSYKLANGLGVGDSKEKIIEAFDDDFDYDDKGFLVKIDEKSGTAREITVYPIQRDEDEEEATSSTIEGFDPNARLEEGMNPGLGVRTLHNRGITGAGVHVGLIDMPLLTGHPEYAGKIVSYYCDAGIERGDSSMHGPAMASLLVGERCGTAPGAKLHMVAVRLAESDAGHCARALDRFVAYNKSVPKEDRIRVVSVSAQPSGEGSLYKNQSLWDESVKRAEAQGILVLDLTWHHGFVSLCWLDPKDRENVEACTPGFRYGPVEVDDGHIHVPTAPRSWAEISDGKQFGYNYRPGGDRSKKPYSMSGYSPTVPYAAGVLAMGWQINPDLTPAQIKNLLFASAYVHESGAKIINPPAFIELIREQSENQKSERRSNDGR
jgi:subtilisin family serine protease